MNGAEIKKVGGFKNEGQAIEFAKVRIGVNEHLCGVVKREDDLTYSASIKPIFKANPSKNADRWHRCLNIFYGKKLTSDHQGIFFDKQTIQREKRKKLNLNP